MWIFSFVRGTFKNAQDELFYVSGHHKMGLGQTTSSCTAHVISLLLFSSTTKQKCQMIYGVSNSCITPPIQAQAYIILGVGGLWARFYLRRQGGVRNRDIVSRTCNNFI